MPPTAACTTGTTYTLPMCVHPLILRWYTSARRYKPDLFWLDAGWVGQGMQALPLATWATAHREVSPRQLWVNRDGGVVEDYLTPENPPPSEALSVGLRLRPKPWEVCMTLGMAWAYRPNDVYKSTKTVLQTLATIVSTGGSLLLDIGPMPTGELPATALSRLAAVGRWMDVNGAAIHDTSPQSPYAMNVTSPVGPTPSPSKPADWQLASNHTAGLSAACDESPGGNPQLGLAECQASCAAGTAGPCNTLNFRLPDVCVHKVCMPAGEPLVSKDGEWDVWVCETCAVAEVQEWRLSRNGNTVYAMLFLTNATLPAVTPLALPFVSPVPGGIDGSWPEGLLSTVTLLDGVGGTEIGYNWSSTMGLQLHTKAAAAVEQPYIAVFRLEFA